MNLKVNINGFSHMVAKRFMGYFWLRRKWLSKSQWLGEKELEQIQLDLLKKLIAHSYDTVPYYRRIMSELNILPENIKSLRDIERFPVISKKDIIDQSDGFISDKYSKYLLRTAYTGGTTGTPLKLKRNIAAIENEHAFVRRQWDWAGIGLNDKTAYLSGRLITKPDQENGQLFAYDYFMKELILSTYHLSYDTAKSYIDTMKDFDIKAIIGYPSAIYLLAQACIESGTKMNLRAVLTSSETLTDSMRTVISQAFDCKVFDFYGGAERVCYIFTCDKGNYHIIPEYGFTELVPVENGGKDHHKIIATGFWNYAMPLIRYDTGDIVIGPNKSCSCGRAFPTVKALCGREADTIRTPLGREYGAAILTHLLYGADNILESQIIQDSHDHVVIEYVPGKKFTEKDRKVFMNLITKHLSRELKIDLKKVSKVQRTQSGKIRPVIPLTT
ncbi:MAG: hypothetical protein P8016_02550 [Sedimentisphaerales bacterium]